MIIETSDNRFYRVTETNHPDLAHVWNAIAVKKVRNQWVDRVGSNGKPQLIRKAATRVIEG